MRILLVNHESNSPYNVFPYGLGYIAAVIKNAGHEVVVYDQAVSHRSDEELFAFMQSEKPFDVMGIGFIAAYFHVVKNTVKAMKAAQKNTPLLLGGSAPSASPAYFLGKFDADYVIVGECEQTILRFLDMLDSKAAPDEVEGLYWRDNNGEIKHTERGKAPENLDDLPFPAWDSFDMQSYTFPRRENGVNHIVRSLGMVTTRGCPYSCKFCFRLEKKFRARSTENCIEEIRYLIDRYQVGYIWFHDDLFMFSKKRILEFSESILENDLKFNWACNARLNIADREQLRVMKKAGCIEVAYGLESGDQKILDEMDKKITVQQMYEVAAISKEEGLLVSVPSMFGLPGETGETLNKTVEAIIATTSFHDKRTIRPMQPYPGSDYWKQCVESGIFKDEDDFFLRFFSSEKWTVNLTKVPDSEIDNLMYQANERLLKEHYKHALESDLEMFQKIYFEKDAKKFIPMR